MILFIDGFDHYGHDLSGNSVPDANAKMLDGIWSQAAANVQQAPASGVDVGRTGPFFLFCDTNSVSRRSLGDNFETVGMGAAYYFPSLPTGSDDAAMMEFMDADNSNQVHIGIDSTGALRVTTAQQSTHTILYNGSEPAIAAGSWHHVEARVTCDAVDGAVEIRVNGVTKVNLTGVNTRPFTTALAGAGRISQIRFFCGSYGFAIDDLFVWSDTGDTDDLNNDFIGDRKVITLFPSADTGVAGLAINGTASGYEAINDSITDSDGLVDDDASYLSSAANTSSAFSLDNLPANAAVVTALQTYARMKKTDAGACNAQISLVSGSDVDDGEDRPMTTAYTYWPDVSELNPTTGAPWTPSEVNAAKLRIAKTA